MIVLRERHGQALIRYDEQVNGEKGSDACFKWWFNIRRMREGAKLKEKNDICCYQFGGSYKERWFMEEFDRRVPQNIFL